MVFIRGQYGPQNFSGRTFDKATVATTLNFTKLKNRWLMGLRADARRACVGLIDRRTQEGSSRLHALLYACHPRLVNGYNKAEAVLG